MRLSGLQRDVLSLYRALLKSALAKSSKEVPWRTRMNDHLYNLVRSEFREKALSVPKTDFRMIEHLIRYGYKQKKLIDMPGFKAASTTVRN